MYHLFGVRKKCLGKIWPASGCMRKQLGVKQLPDSFFFLGKTSPSSVLAARKLGQKIKSFFSLLQRKNYIAVYSPKRQQRQTKYRAFFSFLKLGEQTQFFCYKQIFWGPRDKMPLVWCTTFNFCFQLIEGLEFLSQGTWVLHFLPLFKYEMAK